MKNRRSIAPEFAIDMTPMLDVVFILLIFFIVTASFINEFGLALSRDTVPANSSAENKTVLIDVAADGTTLINQRQIPPRAIAAYLQQLGHQSPQVQVTVRVHPMTLSADYVPIFDAVNLAGITDSAFLLADKP